MHRLSLCLILLCTSLLGSAQNNSTIANQQLKRARSFTQAHQYDSALYYFQQSLAQAGSDSRWARLRKADILHLQSVKLLNEEQYDSALSSIESALDLRKEVYGESDSVLAGIYYQKGRILREKGQLTEALENYKKTRVLQEKTQVSSTKIAGTYNSMLIVLRIMGKYDEAISYGDKALKINLEKFGEKSEEVARNLHNMAVVYRQKGDYIKALDYYERSMTIKEEILAPEHPDLASGFYGMASLSLTMGDFDKALAYVLTARKIWQKVKHPAVSYTDVLLGAIYGEKGDYEQAIAYNRLALDAQKAKTGAQHDIVAGILANIANCHLLAKQFKEALVFSQQALDIQLELLGDIHLQVARSYSLMAKVHTELNNDKQALLLHKKALRTSEQAMGSFNPEVGSFHYAIAEYYTQIGAYELALQHYTKGIDMYLTAGIAGHSDMARSYQQLAKMYTKMGNITAAFEANQKAFETLSLDLPLLPLAQLPVVNHIYSKDVLMDVMAYQGSIWYKKYELTQDTSALNDALQSYQLSADLVDSMRLSYKGRDSKLLLASRAQRIYEAGIKIAFECYQLNPNSHFLEAAFLFMEKSRSVWLNEAIQEAQAKHFSGIPDELLAQERRIKIALSHSEEQLFQAQQQQNEQELEYWRNHRFKFRQQLEELILHFEHNYPKYYQLKYGFQLAGINEIQQVLNKKSLLINYFLTENELYTLCLNQEEAHLFKQSLPKNFRFSIQQLRKSMADWPFIQAHPQLADSIFLSEAHKWYNILLKAPLNWIGEKPEKLLIIPSRELGFIPFEVLLSESLSPPANYSQLPYLLRDFQVSRIYSSNQLLNQYSPPSTFSNSQYIFAGFAPTYEEIPSTKGETADQLAALIRAGEAPLPGARKEVETISKLMGGQAWLDQDATKANFKAEAKHYRILHLAMHGLMNDQNPLYSTLLFSPAQDSNYKLYAAELYNMELEAELVVLSACNSGFGTLKRGEGIISLSHAFSYAGVSSLIMSLWSVTDEATADIMADFYRELKQKRDKDQALQNAKLRYINSADPLYAHPYFWACFVAIGDMKPISTESFLPLWLYILGGLSVILLIGIGIRLRIC